MSCQDLPSDTTYLQNDLKTMVSIKERGVSDKTSSFRDGELLSYFCFSFEGRKKMSSKSL